MCMLISAHHVHIYPKILWPSLYLLHETSTILHHQQISTTRKVVASASRVSDRSLTIASQKGTWCLRWISVVFDESPRVLPVGRKVSNWGEMRCKFSTWRSLNLEVIWQLLRCDHAKSMPIFRAKHHFDPVGTHKFVAGFSSLWRTKFKDHDVLPTLIFACDTGERFQALALLQ